MVTKGNSITVSFTKIAPSRTPPPPTIHTRCLVTGSSVDSYLPEDLSFSEVVGLGMNADEMAANPRLTKRVVQDLNAKVRRSKAKDG